jgi:3-oxoacyl-[acyl-carrier protein] reductase
LTVSLAGRVALVSGGARGIGRSIAAALARAGAEVVLTARSAEAARDVAAAISEDGGKVRGVALDVGDDASVDATFAAVLADYGTIPILVNNAGITRDGLLLRLKREDWDHVVNTDLTGIYRLCRKLVPGMVRGRYGRIVNITSVVAASGNPGQTNYAAAKAGVEGFTRSLALELASRNVTVNCVAPGFIDTDMTRELGEPVREKLLARVPLGRLGQPEEVAAAVVFLASQQASYVTGATLNVNGGMYM